MLEAALIIEGARAVADSGATFERTDPVTGRVLTRAVAAEPADAERAAAAAASAFPKWSETPAAERSAILTAGAEAIAGAAGALVDSAATELGAAPEWIRFNVDLAAAILRQAATLPLAMVDRQVAARGTRSILRRQPAGVVLGFAPWNAPVALAVRAVAAPLACGNTVVLKGSELCPRTHELVVETLNGAGLPSGVLNYVVSAPARAEEIAATLIAHSAVRRVNFTGSTRVGRTIARLAADSLKPCLLELSGKAPLIVLDDADLDAAARAAAYGAFFNRGQICMSTERVIVLDTVADAFVVRLGALARTARSGPLVGTDAALRIRGLVDDALADGAELVAGGEVQGLAIAPTVVDRVHSMMRLYHEECFGPVAAILRVADADEAVSIANDTAFGLAAAVFGRDESRALAVASRLETGICHVNGPTVYDDPAMPFGGMKESGYGRFGGEEVIREFTDLRWIAVHETGGGGLRETTRREGDR